MKTLLSALIGVSLVGPGAAQKGGIKLQLSYRRQI